MIFGVEDNRLREVQSSLLKPFLSSSVIIHGGHLNGIVGIHANIFAFDVILLELICGRASLQRYM
jgi:hypothetical protein